MTGSSMMMIDIFKIALMNKLGMITMDKFTTRITIKLHKEMTSNLIVLILFSKSSKCLMQTQIIIIK